eukprot:6360580-Prymnesium_polylepis.1
MSDVQPVPKHTGIAREDGEHTRPQPRAVGCASDTHLRSVRRSRQSEGASTSPQGSRAGARAHPERPARSGHCAGRAAHLDDPATRPGALTARVARPSVWGSAARWCHAERRTTCASGTRRPPAARRRERADCRARAATTTPRRCPRSPVAGRRRAAA